MLLTIAAAHAALPAFGAANDTVTVTVTGELRQPVHFGIDAERLWFFWPRRNLPPEVPPLAEIEM